MFRYDVLSREPRCPQPRNMIGISGKGWGVVVKGTAHAVNGAAPVILFWEVVVPRAHLCWRPVGVGGACSQQSSMMWWGKL